MNSIDWLKMREKAFLQYGRACQRCNSITTLHVHHKTYDRIFNERIDDLSVLCDSCHSSYHKIYSRATSKSTDFFIANKESLPIKIPKYILKRKKKELNRGG